MAIDPLIARGYQGGIANAMMQGERHRSNMDERASFDARRNALVDIERQQAQQAQVFASQEQQLVQKWAEIAQIELAPPEVQAQWLQQQAQTPGFGQTPFANLPPEKAIPMMKAGLAAKLGKSVEQPQAASLPGEIQRYQYGLENPGFREYEDRNRPQPQPREPREPPQPTLRSVNLPDGTVQDQWLRPGESSGTPVGAPVKPNQDKPMSAKDANTARIKLTQVKVARRQLQDAQAKYAALKGSISAGPGGGLLPTPSGKAYDAAIDTMRSSISALTRVPGIGAMSDFETRLDQAKFPTRNNYESVGEQQLQALGDQLDTIESSYQEMLGGKAAQTTADPEPKVQKTEAPKAALDYLKANPNSKAAFFKKYGYLPK